MNQEIFQQSIFLTDLFLFQLTMQNKCHITHTKSIAIIYLAPISFGILTGVHTFLRATVLVRWY